MLGLIRILNLLNIPVYNLAEFR